MDTTPTPPSRSDSTGAAILPAKPAARPQQKMDRLPPFHVVLLNDDDHSFDYVIEMLRSIFGHDEQMSMKLAKEVDQSGRAVVLTTHREKAELKRDQILSFGHDVRVKSCKGSMSAKIEPAEA